MKLQINIALTEWGIFHYWACIVNPSWNKTKPPNPLFQLRLWRYSPTYFGFIIFHQVRKTHIASNITAQKKQSFYNNVSLWHLQSQTTDLADGLIRLYKGLLQAESENSPNRSDNRMSFSDGPINGRYLNVFCTCSPVNGSTNSLKLS